ncbi:MAG: hypothetical protein K0S61_4874, partial [Anaerocolumna sp.]|nr:hypothetical protein [Anaerocolumna sp.]
MYRIVKNNNTLIKVVIGILIFVEIMMMLAMLSNNKAYAFSQGHPMTDPTPLIQARMNQMGYTGNFYYSIISFQYGDNTVGHMFYASKVPDLLIKVLSGDGNTSYDEIQITSNPSDGNAILNGYSLSNKDNWITSTSSNAYLNRLAKSKNIRVLFSTCNIQYAGNEWVPTGSYLYIVHPTNDDYEYVYDTSIPNIDSMTIKKHSLYEIGGLVIGQSKSKYDVKWQAPSDASLQMELEVVSKYQSIAKRRRMQTPFETMYSGIILPLNELWAFDI